jgi:hypothetical protein
MRCGAVESNPCSALAAGCRRWAAGTREDRLKLGGRKEREDGEGVLDKGASELVRLGGTTNDELVGLDPEGEAGQAGSFEEVGYERHSRISS